MPGKRKAKTTRKKRATKRIDLTSLYEERIRALEYRVEHMGGTVDLCATRVARYVEAAQMVQQITGYLVLKGFK